MLTAAVVALAGATFARNVYDYKASVKYVDLKKTTLNFDGDKVKGYLKVIKSASLTGYLVTDPSCPCTATTDQGYQPPKTGFLVLRNKSAKQGPKLLPAGLYAKAWATKDAWKGTSNAEGYLFAGFGSIAAMTPGNEAVQAFGDDASSESEKLFGAYNSKSKAGTFVETWLDAAGFGKASKGDDDEEGCDFVPGSLCLENLAGSVIGGLWLCAENGYGEKFLCMDWTKTSDVISGSWSIKANKKLAKAELTADEKQMANNTKKDVGGEPNYDILAWVKAAGKAIKKDWELKDVESRFRTKWF